MSAAGSAPSGVRRSWLTAASSAGKIYTSMLSTLADKTAKQITAYLSQYFASRGWIAENKVQKADLSE